MINLTPEQQKAHDLVLDWVKSRHNCLTLGGLAGTGKTTLTAEIARTLKALGLKMAFCTLSGKASTVLRRKLAEVLTDDDYCGTIHSLIYRLIHKETLKNGRQELHFSSDEDKLLPYDLIIVDEASMVSEYMFRDLSAFKIPLFFIGDIGQLPPIKSSFNLMEKPNIVLTKIMRQAEGNPIIKLAYLARDNGKIPYGNYGAGCIKTNDTKFLHQHTYDENSIMLCALNKTRVRMNNFARDILKYVEPYPVAGEPLICLYNNRKKLIFNGNIGTLQQIFHQEDCFNVEIDFNDFTYRGDISKDQFGKEYTSVDDESEVDYFDFGYCISVWKAQGSEFDNVLLLEEGEWMLKDNWNKFLYTAITRAREKIVIFKR